MVYHRKLSVPRAYMLERLTQQYGQTEAVEQLALAYWSIL